MLMIGELLAVSLLTWSKGLAQKLICPATELSNTAYLTCSFTWDFPIQIDSPGSKSVICENGICISGDRRMKAIVVNETYITLNVTDVKVTDSGTWQCTAEDEKTGCNLVVYETPSNCAITSQVNTDRLQEGEEMNMSVSVSGYYCSELMDFHLDIGSETVEVGSDLVSEGDVTQNNTQFNISYKVSRNNIGDVRLRFTCNTTKKILKCDGVNHTALQTCNVSEVREDVSDFQDTVTVDVDEQLSLGVRLLSRECGNYSLYVGDNSHQLQYRIEDSGTGTISYNTTFNVTKSDIGEIHLLYRCEDVRRNLSCGGVRSLVLHSARCVSNQTSIIAGTVAAVMFILATSILIIWIYKRRKRSQKQESGASSPYSTVVDDRSQQNSGGAYSDVDISLHPQRSKGNGKPVQTKEEHGTIDSYSQVNKPSLNARNNTKV